MKHGHVNDEQAPIKEHGFGEWMRNVLPYEITCDAYPEPLVDAMAVALKMFGWARYLDRTHSFDPERFVPHDVTSDTSDGAVYGTHRPPWAKTDAEWAKTKAACNAAIERTRTDLMVRNYTGSRHGTIFESKWVAGWYNPLNCLYNPATKTWARKGSDVLLQNVAKCMIDTKQWTTRDDMLRFFYRDFHMHRE